MDLLQLRPHTKDLGGGFTVRRVLPAAQRQAVGPFLFFDHFGPITAHPSDNHDVRPHPHIGLATVTYLFEGAMMHRDSTGVVQRIEPGAINWMTAGRGIVHSERTPDDLRTVDRRSHGLQLWCAVPAEREEDEPSFSHTPASDIPSTELPGVSVRVMIGEAFGLRSPVPTLSPTLYVDLQLRAGASLPLPAAARERALYAIDQGVELDGQPVPAATMVVLPEGVTPTLSAPQAARVVMVGGEPLGHRHMWWNFVSSRKERIVQAADDWAAQRFPKVPGETEFIPLPEKRP
ncbi:pirin family protein [Piscinibacter sp. HJYY11]|uniref:pirin family protein n=1 Tax=Piscinibacter sp. HJYY11 TaxID=2801333 RepID=UPI00191DB0C1|nr:pirin family protein [Piscinibacter sp. HJYY11]MBL0730211.1 pirin family protein [Piscinibacter sp. HJYY11]